MHDVIVHIARGVDWELAQLEGVYVPPRFAEDGFVHMSRPEQVHLPANALFSHQLDLVLLWVDAKRLRAELRDEAADQGGQAFPHLYGPLDLDAVVGVTTLEPWEPGSFVLPPQPA